MNPSAVGALPLLAILLGAVVAHAQGAPARAFGVNAVAALLGLALVAALGRISWSGRVRHSLVIAASVVVLLATTLVVPGLEGVRRWITLGPVRLNASSVVMPWLLFAVWGLMIRARPALALGFVTVAQAVHVLQPDAGQATAFGAGAALLFGSSRSTRIPWRVAGCAIASLGAAAAWMRPDPLGPVPHVERILHLAAGLGPLWLVASLLAVGALLLPGVRSAAGLRSRHSEAAPLAGSLAVYLGATFAVTEMGNFPVPVLGAGAGPVLGWYCVLGLLQLPWRQPPPLAQQGPSRTPTP